MAAKSFVVRWREEIRDSELGRRERLVAVMLSTWMNRDGVACPSIKSLVDACRMSRSALYRGLAGLIDGGYIERGGTSSYGTTTYRATFPPDEIRF